ncbi:hypothetical protein MLD52_13815 [Puniceicoccaceae bacterium K14]|nr:hypothetical protein [Puniceicoccaceae bacterium K14]
MKAWILLSLALIAIKPDTEARGRAICEGEARYLTGLHIMDLYKPVPHADLTAPEYLNKMSEGRLVICKGGFLCDFAVLPGSTDYSTGYFFEKESIIELSFSDDNRILILKNSRGTVCLYNSAGFSDSDVKEIKSIGLKPE